MHASRLQPRSEEERTAVHPKHRHHRRQQRSKHARHIDESKLIHMHCCFAGNATYLRKEIGSFDMSQLAACMRWPERCQHQQLDEHTGCGMRSRKDHPATFGSTEPPQERTCSGSPTKAHSSSAVRGLFRSTRWMPSAPGLGLISALRSSPPLACRCYIWSTDRAS